MAQAPRQRSSDSPTRLVGRGASDPAGAAAPAGGGDPRLGLLLADRYRIQRKLGEGGMATVYLAEHVDIRRPCAIKVLHAESVDKPDVVERFLQEARAASVIGHENVVEITDYGRSDDGHVFLVMEMLVGEDLADMLEREGPIPWSRARPMLLQICSALAAAHTKGIIHRDLKPENIFRIERKATRDFIKVLDFGIAKVTSESAASTRALTQTGMIFGTPEYMSPEQAEGRKVDPRTDIYSLGVIIYRLLTGKVPFDGESPTTILVRHLVDAPTPPSEAAPERGLTPAIDAVILKALEKDAARRFQTMDEFAEAIAAIDDTMTSTIQLDVFDTAPKIAASARPRRRRLALVIGGGALLLAVAIAAALVLRPEPEPEPAPAPPPPVVAPTPPAAPPPSHPAAVRLRIQSNVPAEILRADDRSRLGSTADPAGISLPYGEAPLSVVLVADGFEEDTVTVTPNRDDDLVRELVKKRRGKAKKSRPSQPAGPRDPY